MSMGRNRDETASNLSLIHISFPLLYWATLALAPVMCVRYVVPLFFTLPLIATIPLLTLKEL